ncbi:hypothetical protein Z950_1519 [Sulfitobacter mediterraneus KCTC 32188]|nr:hypothetical protein Z950_1519 [Sulfitobacter mediterraneus KCTC 32188]
MSLPCVTTDAVDFAVRHTFEMNCAALCKDVQNTLFVF